MLNYILGGSKVGVWRQITRQGRVSIQYLPSVRGAKGDECSRACSPSSPPLAFPEQRLPAFRCLHLFFQAGGLFAGGLKPRASSTLILCPASELYLQAHSEMDFPYTSWILIADSAQLMPCWGNSDSAGCCRSLPRPLGG